MPLNRRTDLADREFLSRSARRVLAQAARDAGDGALGGGGAGTWGSITGDITTQADLMARLNDTQTMDFFLDN